MLYSRRVKEASLKVIGVYRPVISAETWREQFQVTEDEQATREHFEKLVLIEAVVEGLTGRFDFSKFGQVLSGYRNYPDNMQCGYDEGLLSADGETLIQRRIHCVQGTGPLRFAVYLHFYDPQRPLLWQGGESIVSTRAGGTDPFDDAHAVPRLQLKAPAADLNEWRNIAISLKIPGLFATVRISLY